MSLGHCAKNNDPSTALKKDGHKKSVTPTCDAFCHTKDE
jgi:hypothetical protein